MIENRYRLEREIGVGGMGAVWLATDVTLDRQVAMKRAHAISTDRGETTKLQVEAGLATRVRHPNIVEVYGVVGERDDQWLVMEYVPGRSLAQIIADDQVLSVPRAIHYVRQIADALDAVHRAEVVHGDVKPANILIPDNGVAKLSDFGVSRQVWNAETLNTTGPVLGTPAYMAPELLDGKRPAPASDLFALGATLFAAVEGETPYGSDGAPLSMVKRMVHNDMVPMRNAGALAPLLASMLATEPAERPTAAGASRLLRELGGTIDPGTIVEPPPPRRRWLVPSSVVATVVVLGLIGWLVWPKFGGSASTANPPQKTSTAKVTKGLLVPDQTLVQPCGLMNANILAKYGTNVELDPRFGAFDRCDVLFQSHNTTVDVQVDFKDPDSPTGKNTVVVQAPQVNPNYCERSLILTDGTEIDVDAAVQNDAADPNGPIDFCGIDEVATQYAVGVLNRSGVPQRAAGSLTGSLASYNACKLLTPAQVSVVAGVNAGSPQPSFGDWSCEWDGPDPLDVTVTFDQGQPPSSAGGQEVAIGSRAAYVFLDDGGCEADLVYRTYGVNGGKQISEVVVVEVDGNQPQSQQCGLAQVLAQDVGAQLH
ncbi:MAG TPA: protein kinase [Pseudonocardiaceae bacterium]|nr:protein kinase [Pseudonocardiaceae bacterium]